MGRFRANSLRENDQLLVERNLIYIDKSPGISTTHSSVDFRAMIPMKN